MKQYVRQPTFNHHWIGINIYFYIICIYTAISPIFSLSVEELLKNKGQVKTSFLISSYTIFICYSHLPRWEATTAAAGVFFNIVKVYSLSVNNLHPWMKLEWSRYCIGKCKMDHSQTINLLFCCKQSRKWPLKYREQSCRLSHWSWGCENDGKTGPPPL